MTDLATLGIRVEGQEVATADAQLDGLAASAGKAETATERLAAAARGNGAAMLTMNTAVAQQNRVLTVARSSMGLTTAEGLNMGRQMSDVGVQLAMGMSPFMIAIQQGPQILDVFQQAAIRTGTTVRVAMMATGAAVWTALAPLLPIIAAIGAAVAVMGGGIALATRGARQEIGDLTKGLNLTEDQMKRLKEEGISTTTTLGDVFRGTGTTIKEVFFDTFGTQIDWLGDKWGGFMSFAARTAISAVKVIAGGFTGAYAVVRDTWSMLPAMIGDMSVSAANLSIRALNWLVSKSLDGVQALRDRYNALPAFMRNNETAPDVGRAPLMAEMANPWAGAARQTGIQSGQSWAAGFAQGASGVDAAVDRLLDNIGASGRARVRAGAGEADSSGGRGNGSNRIVRERLADFPDLPDLKPLQLMTQQIITPLELISAELRLIDDLTRDMASGLASAFGDTGEALGDLLTVMSGYESRLADINLAEQQHQLTAAQAARERGAAQMGAYGDMAAAARGFFKEGSDGYQAMLAVEQVYRAFQLGAAIQSMAIGGQETAMSVANSLAKGAASTAAGAAKMFEFLGPFAFPAVAAMLALLVGLGLSGSGGGSSGGGSGGRPAANDNDPNATTDAVRSSNARESMIRNSAASALLSRVEVRVSADREGLNAYVVGVAQKEAVGVAGPMVAAAAGGARKDVMQSLRNQQQANRKAVV